MIADERTRTITHREWVLPTPAHHTEVATALAVANQKRDAEPGHPTDIEFTHGDDEIVIGYSVAQHPGVITETVDKILRAERDQWRRKAELAAATVERARRLAAEWSAADGVTAAVWRSASMALHATLDRAAGESAADARGDDGPHAPADPRAKDAEAAL